MLLGLGSLAVNFLQVLKLILVSAYFGATTGLLDEYFAAYNVLLTFQGLLTGSIQAAFTPRYVELQTAGDPSRSRNLLNAFFSLGTTVYTATALILLAFATPVMKLAAMGLPPESLQLQVTLFKLTLFAFVLNGVCDVLTTFYIANKRYVLPAWTPVLNITVSIVWLALFPGQGVFALIYGFIAGAAAQLAVLMLASLRSGGFTARWTPSFAFREHWPTYVLMVPIAASLLINHGNLLIDQTIASTLGAGAISVLNYALRMHDVLMRLFVVSLNGVILPYLSQYVAEKRFAELRSTMALGSRLMLLVLIPVTALIWLFGGEVISAVFQRKSFTAEDSRLVGVVWAVYSLSLFTSAWGILSARCLTAFKDLQPLWIISLIVLPLNLVLNLVFSRHFGITGIALATAGVYLVASVLNRVRLETIYRRQGALPSPEAVARQSSVIRSLAAIAVFVAAAAVLRAAFDPWVRILATPDALHRTMTLAAAAATALLAGAVYAAALRLLKVREADSLWQFTGAMLLPRLAALSKLLGLRRPADAGREK